ncbi:MAG TPA: lysozyme [Blastocatellia bacterium]|jgi:lysozyme|nr:lysozyme [Blastocatellia bacterium]
MQLSANGLNFIKQWEGFRATPYNDGYGSMTIGYGHKIRAGESFTQISEAQASQLLAQDVGWAEDTVSSYVSVPLTQSQFDALVSLTFNWGAGNFAQSQLLQRLNAGDYSGAAERLGEWPVTSGGVYSAGLANRRQAEKSLFLSEGSPVTTDQVIADQYFPTDQMLPGAPEGAGIPLLALALGGLVLIVILAR